MLRSFKNINISTQTIQPKDSKNEQTRKKIKLLF